MEVNRPRFLSLKPRVEELVRVRKTGALKEVHLHIPLESTDRYYQPIVRPDRRVPLPLFGDGWVGVVNDLAKRDHYLPTPVLELCNLLVDKLGGMTNPLPNLSPTNFYRSSVLHQVVYGYASETFKPGLQIS